MKSNELKLCGLAAVRARFARDAMSIHRLYFDYATGRKVPVNGYYGYLTARAVKSYRKANGLRVIPTVTKEMWTALQHGKVK